MGNQQRRHDDGVIDNRRLEEDILALEETVEVLDTKIDSSNNKTRLLVWFSIVVGVLAEIAMACYAGGTQ